MASLCAVWLAACSGQPPTSQPAPATGEDKSAHAAIMLRDGWHARVLVDRDDSIILTLPSGDRQLQQFERRAAFTLAMDGSGRVSIRLDSFSFHPRAPEDAGVTAGASWAGQPTDPALNAMRVVSGGSSAAELTAVVRALLPRLPVGGVHARMNWSDSAAGSVRVDIFSANERRTASWTSGSLSARADGQVLAVKLREDFEQLGDGQQGGRKMTMTSQGRRSGTYYLTSGGEISSARLDDSVAMLISIPSTRQVVPTIRYGRTMVRYYADSPE